MATKVPIPKLGQSEEVVTIADWKVKEGDVIKKGDVLFEVETDKAVLEVESQFEGTLLKILVPAGKEVPVMTVGAVIGEPGEEIPDIAAHTISEPFSQYSACPFTQSLSLSEQGSKIALIIRRYQDTRE